MALAVPSSGPIINEDRNSPYKALGRVLVITASVCAFVVHESKIQNDTGSTHHFGLLATMALAMVYGVVVKAVDLTQEHGLRLSATKENTLYIVALITIYIISTKVDGGQSFMSYHIVYHGLIKAKADTPKHLITATAVYSMWIIFAWKGLWSTDWLFVVLSVSVSTVWSILNNKILHMGDSVLNQIRADILYLMVDLIAFDYGKFIGPALLMIVYQVAYTTTKVIAKTQTWYIKSKREDMVAKDYLTKDVLFLFGCLQWYLVYFLMLWEGIYLGTGTWPVIIGSYFLIWESFDGFFNYFNKGTTTTSSKLRALKRIGNVIFSVMDAGLHVLFVLYGFGTTTDEIGLPIPQTVRGRVLYLAIVLSVWISVCVLCSRFKLSRQFKYIGTALHSVQHASMLRLPAYASSALLMTVAWVSTIANFCFISILWSPNFPKPKLALSFFALIFPLVTAIENVFSPQLRMISVEQFSLIISIWCIIVLLLLFLWH